jgi:mannose-6-phosphate isomerase-like protein (cupin superfamily)
MKATDVLTELAKHPQATFLDLAKFNNSTIGGCDIQGESPVWEMHPDTDEFFYVIEGEIQFTLLTQEGEVHRSASAGSVLVMPRGVWHKPASSSGVKFIYMTPGKTLHSEAPELQAGATA